MDAVDCINLYDFRNRPFEFAPDYAEHDWRAAVISFGLKHYRALSAESDLSAEDIPSRALDLWRDELSSKQQKDKDFEEKNRCDAARREALETRCVSQKTEIEQLKKEREISNAWRLLFVKDWMPTAIVVVVISIFTFSVGFGFDLVRALP